MNPFKEIIRLLKVSIADVKGTTKETQGIIKGVKLAIKVIEIVERDYKKEEKNAEEMSEELTSEEQAEKAEFIRDMMKEDGEIVQEGK